MIMPSLTLTFGNAMRHQRSLGFLLTVLDVHAAHDASGIWPTALPPLPGQYASLDRSAWTLESRPDGFTLTAPPLPGDRSSKELLWKFPGGTLAPPRDAAARPGIPATP